jgi:hypothetical protein
LSEITANGVQQEVEILDQDRLIEAIAGADESDRLIRRLGSQHDPHRIAWRKLNQHEGDQADSEDYRNQLHRALEQKCEAVHGLPI